ncbi:MAG: ArsR/SmtB family transcription factor [Bosea sp. (in: a-proteobacteria)]
MKISSILAELGNDTRLAVFQTLVGNGKAGMTVGQLQAALDVPASTLAFHIKGLTSVGLVSQERDGRSVICRARLDVLNSAFAAIQEQCCRAGPVGCAPSAARISERMPALEIAV